MKEKAFFFAVLPGEELQKTLGKAIDCARQRVGPDSGITWTSVSELHLTVAHMKNVRDPKRLIDIARQALKDVPSFEVEVLKPIDHTEELEAIDHTEVRGRRVIYAPCKQKDRFKELLKACRAIVEAAGLHLSNSDFQAHFTLGKTEGPRNRSNWPISPDGPTVGILRIDEVKLFESTKKGYIRKATFRLRRDP